MVNVTRNVFNTHCKWLNGVYCFLCKFYVTWRKKAGSLAWAWLRCAGRVKLQISLCVYHSLSLSFFTSPPMPIFVSVSTVFYISICPSLSLSRSISLYLFQPYRLFRSLSACSSPSHSHSAYHCANLWNYFYFPVYSSVYLSIFLSLSLFASLPSICLSVCDFWDSIYFQFYSFIESSVCLVSLSLSLTVRLLL